MPNGIQWNVEVKGYVEASGGSQLITRIRTRGIIEHSLSWVVAVRTRKECGSFFVLDADHGVIVDT